MLFLRHTDRHYYDRIRIWNLMSCHIYRGFVLSSHAAFNAFVIRLMMIIIVIDYILKLHYLNISIWILESLVVMLQLYQIMLKSSLTNTENCVKSFFFFCCILYKLLTYAFSQTFSIRPFSPNIIIINYFYFHFMVICNTESITMW